MDAASNEFASEKMQLLQRLAELAVEEQRQRGVFKNTPHYSVLEDEADHMGRLFSRLAQERAAREVAAEAPTTVACPTCGCESVPRTQTRTVKSLAGPVQIMEPVAHCSACRRDFFPSA